MIYTFRIHTNFQYTIQSLNENIQKEIRSNNIRILGHDFVRKNKNKVKIIINNKKFRLKEFVNIKEIEDDKLKVNIIMSNELSNISHMFENCVKLIEFSYNDNFVNIEEEKEEAPNEFEEYFDIIIKNGDRNEDGGINFYKYIKDYSNPSEIKERTETNKNNKSTLSFFKDKILSYQNNNNYTDMSWMFYNCISLLSLSGISNWNTNKVTNMKGLFENCSSLTSLPDISNWNTNNVIDISKMFDVCK